ncbi:CLUMA_CG001023, isoform A [Clunio marinus]|uniref:CLUMA_CG001023, isoform A n=1 Tax=Clunio marinus TaxID=568069 RepID=A0A1J1HH59_9DIPT|nr:CLUMA_CG001023, isoform A [Clunio marinus]
MRTSRRKFFFAKILALIPTLCLKSKKLSSFLEILHFLVGYRGGIPQVNAILVNETFSWKHYSALWKRLVDNGKL